MTSFQSYIGKALNESVAIPDLLAKSSIKSQKELRFSTVKGNAKYILVVTNKSNGVMTYTCTGKEAIVLACNMLFPRYDVSDYEDLYDDNDNVSIEKIVDSELSTGRNNFNIFIFNA